MHSALSPGDVLRVRGQTWILHSVTAHADCRELDLVLAEGESRRDGLPGGFRLVLLTPFDRPVRLAAPDSVRVVSRRAWIEALRRAILGQRGSDGLVAPVHAAIDLLPHQLEPALAVVHRGASRLLLADEVGLGKTIEAGLVLAELHARGELKRALILTPPGLRDQWTAEMADRFRLDTTVADAAWLRTCRATLPADVNPWSVPGIFVTSFDFAKRPEVLRSLEAASWDAVVLDEAHEAAGDSERRSAADAIARRARLVLLLTATPHSGDASRFEALCRIGSLAPEDPIVIVRRGRAETGLARRRRVSLRRIGSTPSEQAVRRQLDDYIRSVWTRKAGPDGRDARLAMTVLLKRSFSGMAPLRRSLQARLAQLGPVDRPAGTQLPLAWDEEFDASDEAPAAELRAPGFDDATEERKAVASLVELAYAAEAHDSKQRAIVRLLRRVREPVIVFSEYRDTLASLQSLLENGVGVLHGGLDRADRAAVLYRFTSGGLRALLATDAAGEGLNLQHGCRIVVNLELPWNPMRLEQRIGRVDRIGQPREVRAINMVAGATAESDLLARLVQRLDRARAAVGPIEDVLGEGEEDVVSQQLGVEPREVSTALSPRSGRRATAPFAAWSTGTSGEARVLTAHLEWLRRLSRAAWRRKRGPDESAGRRNHAGVFVTAVRHHRMPGALRRTGVLAIFSTQCQRAGRHMVPHTLVPVFLECRCPPIHLASEAHHRANAFIREMAPQLGRLVESRTPPTPLAVPVFDRDARLAQCALQQRAVQRGLFDARAEREAAARDEHAREMAAVQDAEDAADRCGATAPNVQGPRLELIVFITA